MTIGEIMRGRKVATVGPDDDVGLAIQLMLWSNLRHLPVVSDGAVVGVLSERDILRRSTEVGPRAARREPVARAMTAPAITMEVSQPLVAATWLMSARKLGCLPVTDGGRLAGIITSTDLVHHQFAEESGKERAVQNRQEDSPADR